MTPQNALLHPHKAPPEVKKLFDTIDGKPERIRAQPVRDRLRGRGAETEAAEAATGAERGQS